MSLVYDFDTSSHSLKSYYPNQSGGGLPVFHGSTRQRGYGIGGIFFNLFRRIAPVLKNVAKTTGKQLVKTGANFVSDVIDAKTLKKAALTNLSSGGQELISSLSSKLSSRKRGWVKRKTSNTVVKRKRRCITEDIFKQFVLPLT